MNREAMRRIDIFTDKYPLLGPTLWMLSIQYLITTYIVAQAWPITYDWKNNYISDLGNTVCGQYDGFYVCSPLHILMNLSFVVFGGTIAVGSVLIYTEFRRTITSFIGFGLMSLSGIGTIIVGFFPENTWISAHQLGALFGLGVGNVSIIALSLALREVNRAFRIYSFMSGVAGIAAFVLFVSMNYVGLGRGGIERVASYVFAVWMISFGIYTSVVHVKARRVKSRKSNKG